jgi:hypothetical protein
VLSGEATNRNCIVFGLTRPRLEPTIYRTRGEYANHYATDAVRSIEEGQTTQWGPDHHLNENSRVLAMI